MSERTDPQQTSRYSLQIDGITTAQFNEVTIPDISVDPIEWRTGDDPPTSRKIPGLIKYGNVVLKSGVTDSMDLYNWYKAAILDQDFNSERKKSIQIMLNDEKGEKKVEWDFINCLPIKYDAPDLKASGNEIAIETLEFAHEGMTRVQ